MIGFGFHETMSGSYHDGDKERPISFTLDVRAPNLVSFLLDRDATMAGHVDAPGLATRAPLAGTMRIDPVLGRVIGYRFTFTGDNGKSYRFAGQKDVSALRLVESMTTLRGELTDETDGRRVGDATLLFDIKHLPSFLLSWRPVR